MSNMDLEPIKKIIREDNPGLLVQQAESIGRQAASNRLTTNQIRNVYGPVRQINWPEPSKQNTPEDKRLAGKAYREVVLLKPKLAYLAAREPKLADLESILSTAIDEIGAGREDERHVRFQRFVEFFEAILAYHKKYGGK